MSGVIGSVATVLRAPFDRKARHTIGQLVNTYYHSRGGRRDHNPNGIDVLKQDWDNLVILDACRYDAFEAAKERHAVPGRLKSRISRGSQTPEWLKANFGGRKLHDVVYVTGTAMPYHLSIANPDDPSSRQQRWGFDLDVHDLVNVWMDPPAESLPLYEDRIQSRIILPEAMRQEAVAAEERYPHKRLVVHIVPPHDPYIGPTGEEIHEMADNPWRAYLNGELDIDIELLRTAYRENVDLAVKAAKDLTEDLSGRTVISSDHGDLLWERSGPFPTKEYLHPEQTYVPELVRVPWNVTENGSKTTHADPPTGYKDQQTGEDDARGQLRALGYID